LKICNSNQIRRILVRAPNWIGDAVLCLPALERLKSAYPQADMTVLAKPWVSPVFSHNPAIKRIIEYDTSVRHRGIYGKWRLVQVIRGYGFDMAVLFQNAFEAALIAFLSRIPVRIGYNRDGRRLLLTYPVELTSDIKRAHHVAYYLNIIDRIQKPEYRTQNKNISQLDKENRPKLYLTEKEKDWSKGFLNDKGIDSGIIIGIAPGATPETGFEIARLTKPHVAVPYHTNTADSQKKFAEILKTQMPRTACLIPEQNKIYQVSKRR